MSEPWMFLVETLDGNTCDVTVETHDYAPEEEVIADACDTFASFRAKNVSSPADVVAAVEAMASAPPHMNLRVASPPRGRRYYPHIFAWRHTRLQGLA